MAEAAVDAALRPKSTGLWRKMVMGGLAVWRERGRARRTGGRSTGRAQDFQIKL